MTDGRAEEDALREIERGRLRALVAGDIERAQALVIPARSSKELLR